LGFWHIPIRAFHDTFAAPFRQRSQAEKGETVTPLILNVNG
jgi:hypothetical protein